MSYTHVHRRGLIAVGLIVVTSSELSGTDELWATFVRVAGAFAVAYGVVGWGYWSASDRLGEQA